ncbi:MAG: hypothetical protein QOI06_85 [Nocardioidaceae bacterium]|jgi:uncharacterized protein (TIGR02453 family)|nr:hypothetical protein [Nocardioidaceae bacterium]
MDHVFEGFGPAVFEWFEELERDNSRDFFAATRKRYDDEVRGGLEAMLEELADVFGGDVKMFRQHRDLRFSRDKSPYKTTTYGLLYDVPGALTGLYAQLSSRGLYAGTGYYRMSPDQLQRYRQAVAEDGTGSRLAKEVGLARERGLTVEGGGLRTAPRGYPKDHPRIELLRMTSVIVGRAWPAADGISRGAALGGVTETWRSAQAVTSWLDEHVGRAVG